MDGDSSVRRGKERMEEKKMSFEEELKQIHNGYKRISKKTGIKMKELISVIMIRELVIANQLKAIHEHLDAHFPLEPTKKIETP